MSAPNVSAPKRKVRFSLTSAEAAASISEEALTELQAWIMVSLRESAKTDAVLVDAHLHAADTGEIGRRATPQRVRTARKELVIQGLVEWSGSFSLTQFSRRTQIWRAAA